MSIQLLNKNGNPAAGDDSHRKRAILRNVAIVAGLVLIVGLCLWALYYGYANRNYETYEVLKSFERSDTMMTQYTEFQNYVLKYGKDGISCVDSRNRSVWSQPYNMQNPLIYVCKNSVALAEEGGTDAMIFDASGLQGSIKTNYPIRQIAVSSQGVLAALMDDGDVMRLNLYNKKGEELVNSHFALQDTGYPLRMSLSTDATKLAVAFLQVQDGGISTCLAFYNFDSVGENYSDHMVAAQTVADRVISSIQYIDETHCFAVGTDTLYLFEGKQIPELAEEIPIEREIYSIFSSDKEIGLVLEGEEQEYALQVYSAQGRLKFETEFDLEYQTLKFSGKNILIYNEFECIMMNQAGRIFYSGTFEESISNLYTQSGRAHYILMHASRTDQICLK